MADEESKTNAAIEEEYEESADGAEKAAVQDADTQSEEQKATEEESSTVVEIPKMSEQADTFIKDIVPEDYELLDFADNLVTVSNAGKELGEFRVTVEMTKHNEEACFLVHANSHGSIDGVPCGTSITSFVGKQLQTFKQEHHEYVKLENHPLDRKTFLVQEGEQYVLNRVITQGKDTQRMSKTYAQEDMQGFVSEGSNLLLQRLLAKKGVPDDFQMISFDADSNICPVIYKSLEERKQTVQETELEVVGIERTINSVTDLPISWQSYFMKDGRLANRVQVGSPVTMKLSVVPRPLVEDDKPAKPTFPKKDLVWEEDMEMFSKYLDRKEKLKNDHAVYLKKHPELKALLADYLQFLLLRKPEDTIAFSADYFSSFSSAEPNPPPYQRSSQPSPYNKSRMSPKIKYLSKTDQ